MYRIAICFYILISFAKSDSENYVLLVSFDGFRSDYTNMVKTPNFDRIEQKGIKAEGLISVFPSLTFPNHYSIATGSYSGTHNITGNSFYDKEFKEKYSLYDKETVRDPKFYKSEPIWVTAERQGIKTASFYWVGSEAAIKGLSPSIFKYYDGSVPFKSRVDSVITWFQLPKTNRPKLVMLYFSEPDYTGHKFGVNSIEIKKKINEMDDLLGYLIKNLEKLAIFTNLNVIIVSDHGMVDVSDERLIILDTYLSKMDEISILGRGSHVQFDVLNFDFYTTSIFENELNSIPHSQFWEREKIPNRFHFNNANTGDYLLLAEEGWYITTNKILSEENFSVKGMHGYDPRSLNMQGIFYAYGEKIKSDMQIPSFENIHIYPLICKLLDIIPYEGIEDSPSGNLNVLQKILIQEN